MAAFKVGKVWVWALAVAAGCGGKIQSAGEGGVDSGGADGSADGGEADADADSDADADADSDADADADSDADADADPGTDADADGYTLESGDCDDADPTVNQGQREVCYDGKDNDCRSGSPDCDCDADGVEGASGEICTTGTDCDDADPDVYPGAVDLIDGLDNNCDGVPDEGGYCNAYFPLENAPGNSRIYSSTSQSGTIFVDTVAVEGWDPSAGVGLLRRTMDDGGGTSYEILEERRCDTGQISMQTWEGSAFGFPVATVNYSAPRVDLPPADDLSPGAAWEFSYDATDTAGLGDWSVSGRSEVLSVGGLTVPAGSFTAVEVRTTYTIVDNSGGDLGRSGEQNSYYVEGLGLIYAEDYNDLDELVERRELGSYVGFFP
ncbi:MAG: putative metal-binding motif-containing protein [Deltaproteobacteria bacterium]|nr:putative metal-binding motif-containing protein [Deltaproteobacteria bacterium]